MVIYILPGRKKLNFLPGIFMPQFIKKSNSLIYKKMLIVFKREKSQEIKAIIENFQRLLKLSEVVLIAGGRSSDSYHKDNCFT